MPLSAAEQYLLELINRARLDPLAEAERYGVALNDGLDPDQIGSGPLQVLAHNEALSAASEAHSIWMLGADTFSHTGNGQSSAGERMADAGYDFTGSWAWRENLAWSGTTGTIDLGLAIEHHHQGLYLSSGHRANTFSTEVREVGLAQVEGSFTVGDVTYNSSMLTQNYALSGPEVFVTGVAYRDADGDDFYSIGEGLGGVAFSTDQAQDSTSLAGGYGIGVAAQNDVRVTVTQDNSQLAVVRMDLTAGNGKLDLVADAAGDFALHLSTDAVLISGIGDATLLGAGDLSLRGNSAQNALMGNRGDNHISGMGGRDILRGGDGDDLLAGGRGLDRLYGQNGQDHLLGGGARDRLFGGSDDDILEGGGGRDILRGGAGDDILEGGRGNDLLIGGGGADTFIFDHGDDRIVGFNADVDQIEISAQLMGDAELVDLMSVQNGHVVLDFDGGHSLTIRGHDDINSLLDDISFV